MQDKDGGKDMEQSLNEWERLITDYEEQSLEPVSDNIRVSTLLEHLPSPFREVLMQGPPDSRKTYVGARAHLKSFTGLQKPYVPQNLASNDMQVGAITGANGSKGGKGGKKERVKARGDARSESE